MQQSGTLLHPKPAGFCLQPSGACPAPNPGIASGGPTFSHLNALRAAMRIEAYGLYAQKWAEKPLGRPQTPFFSNRSLLGLESALPLNKRILWGSDLCRVSRPTSAAALIKGQMNLFASLDQKGLSYRGPTGEVDNPPDRLRGSRRQKGISMATRHQSLVTSDWEKAGVQPKGGWRFFGSLLCVQK